MMENPTKDFCYVQTIPRLQRWLLRANHSSSSTLALPNAFDFTPLDETFTVTLHSLQYFAKEGLDMNLTKTECFQLTQDFGIRAHL
jgi:hypothetical protein